LRLLGELEDPHVRDLAWAIERPCLKLPQQIEDEYWLHLTPVSHGFGARDDYERWLRALDRDPRALYDFIAARGPQSQRRVGYYFEALLGFHCQNAPMLELVAQNVAIRDGGVTLGELDLLYRRGKKTIHCEAAIKFYLAHQGEWVGPNKRDRLRKKVAKLLHHQAPLCQKPLAQRVLEAQGITVDHSEVVLLGYLFERGQPETTRHFWNTKSALLSAREQRDDLRVLVKPHWLAPPTASHLEQAKPLDRNTRLPVQLLRLDQNRQVAGRGFCVSDSWP
jgi:hypothetical protein